MKLVRLLALVAALGVAAFFGAQWERSRAPAASAAPDAAAARVSDISERTISALREENRQLRSELNQARTERTAAAAPGSTNVAVAPQGLERLQMLTELKRAKLASPAMTFVDRKGRVTDAFANVFALSESERGTLQRTVERARDQLGELERANATVTPNDRGEVVIAVKSFSEAGGQVFDELMRGFAQTLGPERNAAFLALGSEQVEESLGRFGAAERTLTFGYDPQRTSPYQVRDQRRTPNGSGMTSSTFKAFDEVVEFAGPVSRLLPANFGPGR